jgi:hypothetical protein
MSGLIIDRILFAVMIVSCWEAGKFLERYFERRSMRARMRSGNAG